MRITNRQLTTTYLYNTNKNLEKYAEQNEKIFTGRAYNRISQNVSTAKKALQTRTEYYRNEQYQENVDFALEQISTAESSLMAINDQMQNVESLALRAVHGTNTDETSREIFMATLEETKEGFLDSINAVHLDKYILGGTNNREIPFKTDADGNLMFNGINVDDIKEIDGTFFDADGKEVPLSRDTYIDIGLGLKMNGENFDTDSAFRISFSGVKWTGYGTSEITYTDKEGYEVTEEVSNNMYQIMSDMQKCLEENDMERLSALTGHFSEQYDELLTGIAELGVKANHLEEVKTQLDNEEVSIEGMHKEYEGIDDTTEIVALEEYNYAWMLTLKFGGNILPQSLMDYIG